MYMAKLLILISVLSIAACSTNKEISDETIFTENEQDISGNSEKRPMTMDERAAYQAGVEDVLNDFKGKMQGQKEYVFEPAHIECGVRVPAQVVNGSFIPSHETCIQVSPSVVRQQDAIQLPVMGD